jgi:hypothetical protein
MGNEVPYTGLERRRLVTSSDEVRLDTALEEIRRLHGAATELATVVARTVPREEVEARQRQFRWLLVALGMAVVFLVVFSIFMVARILDRFNVLEDGQRSTRCLITKTEAERTGTNADTAVLACTSKR